LKLIYYSGGIMLGVLTCVYRIYNYRYIVSNISNTEKFSIASYLLELGNVSYRVRFVFGLNLNGLKNPKPEPNLFNKRVKNFNSNRLKFKRVNLNPTHLHKQAKWVGFRSPIYLPTYLIVLIFNPKINLLNNNNHCWFVASKKGSSEALMPWLLAWCILKRLNKILSNTPT